MQLIRPVKTPILRQISNRYVLCRYKSESIPDNAPGLIENEEWLNSLNKYSEYPESGNLGLSIPDKITDAQGFTQFNVIEQPTRSRYIKIESAISNFTSLKYFKQFDKTSHQIQSNFVDVKIIQCRSGSGGNGCISFLRDANRRVGPPNGGDGGTGGSIYVQAVPGMNSLAKLKARYIAGDGRSGGSDQLDGARGRDILIKVPAGTILRWCINPNAIREVITKEMEKNPKLSVKELLNSKNIKLDCSGRYSGDKTPSFIQLFRTNYEPGGGWLFKDKTEEYHSVKSWFQELSKKVKQYDYNLLQKELANDKFPLHGIDMDTTDGKPICILKGGQGGLGNMHFLTSMIRNPRFAKCGRKGLETYFQLELKTIADLGLVGLPNAGKSTILNKISNARPRIGHWEFTTLVPTIGTVIQPTQSSFTVADIPGIVKDARFDRGMGLEFLKHIERSKGWVFVLSLENDTPLTDLYTLITEVGGIDKVKKKNILVVCNKADINPNDKHSVDKYLQIKKFCDKNGWDSIPISALNEENIDVLVNKMYQCTLNI